MKKQKIIYRIIIGFMVVVFGLGGIANLFKFQEVMESLLLLGYPTYFGSILGTAQILGTVILLLPRTRRLKEFVFFGFIFNLLSALVSHLVVEGVVPVIAVILIILAIVIVGFKLTLNDKKIALNN